MSNVLQHTFAALVAVLLTVAGLASAVAVPATPAHAALPLIA